MGWNETIPANEAHLHEPKLKTDEGTADALSGTLHLLAQADQGFAGKLLMSYDKYKSWSPKQRMWAKRLAHEGMIAEGIATVVVATADTQPDMAANVGDFSEVIALFKKAQVKLQFPTVELQVEDQGKKYPVVLKMAGKSSSAPGTITVTDGRPYGSNVYYGRVKPDGKFLKNHSAPTNVMTAIVTLLQAFGANPAGIAAAYGHFTGRCCFCKTEITDPKSLEVGYGPICAKRWHLPHGTSKNA